MKNISCFIALLLLTGNALFAQVGIGADNNQPDNSAMLDVKSTSRGFLPPRMTTVQRDQIISPATGLTIYNITRFCNETYNGSVWVSNTHCIGESYGGGIVFYIYDNGLHGLIAATADQSTAMRWYNGTNRITGSAGDGLNAGAMNTTIIVTAQMSDNQSGNFAAKVCADYSVTVGGVTYGDWYLPSKLELNLLYQQKGVAGVGNNNYWSSTEDGASSAFSQYFLDGNPYSNLKIVPFNVRAVRAF